MTNNFFIFLKVFNFALGIILILLAASMPFSILWTAAFSGLDGVDILGLFLSVIAIFGTMYVLYKVVKTQNKDHVIMYALGILVYIFILVGYGINYESLWKLEALLRGIQLLP